MFRDAKRAARRSQKPEARSQKSKPREPHVSFWFLVSGF